MYNGRYHRVRELTNMAPRGGTVNLEQWKKQTLWYSPDTNKSDCCNRVRWIYRIYCTITTKECEQSTEYKNGIMRFSNARYMWTQHKLIIYHHRRCLFETRMKHNLQLLGQNIKHQTKIQPLIRRWLHTKLVTEKNVSFFWLIFRFIIRQRWKVPLGLFILVGSCWL